MAKKTSGRKGKGGLCDEYPLEDIPVKYTPQADRWVRDRPKNIGDLTHRPMVVELVRQYGTNGVVLDAGCGEGYMCRICAKFAFKVIGVDISPGMIERARQKEDTQKLGIDYHVGDIRNLSKFVPEGIVDCCFSNVTLNYLDNDGLNKFLKELNTVLKPRSHFVFALPHPHHALEGGYGPAMDFDATGYDYYQSQNKFFRGKVLTMDGDIQEIGMYHRTLEYIIDTISDTRLRINRLIDVPVTKDMVARFPFLRGCEGKTPYIIIDGGKP